MKGKHLIYLMKSIKWIDGWIDEWMDWWMDGWMDGWMDISLRHFIRQAYGHYDSHACNFLKVPMNLSHSYSCCDVLQVRIRQFLT